MRIGFTVDSSKDKWWFHIYNKFLGKVTPQRYVNFNIKPYKREIWVAKNLRLKNNKIYWDESEDKQIQWYILYLKKILRKKMQNFQNRESSISKKVCLTSLFYLNFYWNNRF